MATNLTTRRSTAVVSWLVLACFAGCSRSPVSPSPAPGGSPTVASIAIAGPSTLAPGATASYAATARFSDGSTRDVTSSVSWHATPPGIVEFGPDGVAVARSTGETVVRAQYQAFSPPLGILVLEAGTFKLSGRVTDVETGQPIPAATLEVADGVGAGLRATTDEKGRYALYGVAGDVRVTVTAEGRVARTEIVPVHGPVVYDIALSPIAAAVDLSGRWVLTVTASPGCDGPPLPEPAISRQFVAAIEHTGSRLDVLLSSPSVVVADGLSGRIFGNALSIPIFYWPGDVVDGPYYGLLDALQPQGFLGIWGAIQATVDGPRIDGVLDGGIHFYKTSLVLGAYTGCEGRVGVVSLQRQ